MADDPKGLLDRLDRELDDLRHQYELFFSGGRKSEPGRERAAFETALRKQSQRTLVNTEDQFRFSSLQARYYSFANHWTRTVRDMEEGRLARDAKGRLTRPAPVPAPAQAAAPAPDPAPADPVDPAHLDEAAYNLAAARAGLGLPGGSLRDIEGIRDALLAKARDISGKGGGKQVEFRISVEEGKPKIRAVLK